MTNQSAGPREVWVEATVEGRQDHTRTMPNDVSAEPQSLLVNVRLLMRMLADKAFRIPGKTKLYLLGALIYLVSPIDLIPDVFFGLGYVDDAVMIGFALRNLNDTLNLYRRFLNGRS